MDTVIAQLISPEGSNTGPPIDVPLLSTPQNLNELLNELLAQSDDPLPYAFYVHNTEITSTLTATLHPSAQTSTETVLPIRYQPQALFRVRPVTRSSASIPGHAEAVLSAAFSPDARNLATASGDCTVRLWDLSSQTPGDVGSGLHKNWVLNVAWAPDAEKLASGDMDGVVAVWAVDTKTTARFASRRVLGGHKKWITSISWEPMHAPSGGGQCRRVATASKDGTVRVWDVVAARCERVITGHTLSVTCVRWGGEGLIYTASQDRSIKVWDAADGTQRRSLDGHAHWVTTMSLSTDYLLRTGAFDYKCEKLPEEPLERMAMAGKRYLEEKRTKRERLVSGSDDFTVHLWEPMTSKKALCKMVGHQQLVNDVRFSPDQMYIASGSFDKSVRLWDGLTGKYLAAFRGHVGAVYQIAWSADSRLLLSASKDSTLKVWEIRTRKQKGDLPGHADEVFTADWSPDGARVATGGKDRVVKLWHH